MTTSRRPRISRRVLAIGDLALGLLGTIYVIVQIVRIMAEPSEFIPWVTAYIGLMGTCFWFYRFGEYRKTVRREAHASHEVDATPEPEN